MVALVSRTESHLAALLTGRAFWGIEVENGGWYTQLHHLVDVAAAQERELRWYDDLVATSDVLRIKELWLFCPRSKETPWGAECGLKITEKGTAFHCAGRAINVGTGRGYPTFTLVGRVNDKDTGACELYVWDALVRRCYHHYANVREEITQWREGGPLVGRLALDRVGLRIPYDGEAKKL